MNAALPNRVWLASYPRSGNTFFRVLLKHWYGLNTGSRHNDSLLSRGALSRTVGVSKADEIIAKTHHKEEDSAPAIYLVRDGRQVMVSYWHWLRRRSARKHSLTDVIRGQVGYGAWGEHVKHWMGRTPEPTVVKFEELVGERFSERCLRNVLASVGVMVEPVTDEPPPAFDALHERAPGFFRAGRTDEWLEVLGPTELDLFYKLHGGALSALGYAI